MPATMISKKEPGRTPPESQGKVCGLLTPSFAAGNPQGCEDSTVAKVIPSLEYFVTATLENESLISHSLTRAQQKARWKSHLGGLKLSVLWPPLQSKAAGFRAQPGDLLVMTDV